MFDLQITRKVAFSFMNLFVFVVLILWATTMPGQNGMNMAIGITLPLSSPWVVFISLAVGVFAAKYRNILLFALPATFCIGLVSGLMLQPFGSSYVVGIGVCLSLISWIACLWLLTNTRSTNLCMVFLMPALVLGVFQPLPTELQGLFVYIMFGMLLSVGLLMACGACATIALAGVKHVFPHMDSQDIWKLRVMLMPGQPARKWL